MTMSTNTPTIDDIDLDDDLLEVEELKPYLEGHQTEGSYKPASLEDDDSSNNNQNSNESLVDLLLKQKGIENSLIKFEDEEGNITEIPFTSLTKEEQFSILNDDTNNSETELDDDEIDFINNIRSSGLTAKEYENIIKQKAIEEYLENNETQVHYEVNDLTDEELFIADYKLRFPTLSEEDILSALEVDKANERLFTNKMQILRNSYIEKEKEYNEQLKAEENYLKQQQEEEFKTKIINSAATIANIGEFKLDHEDIEEVTDFLLGTDTTGSRYISKALNEPETLFKMAWFALKGEEALDQLSKYYKDVIKDYAKANYKKGMEDALSGKSNSAQARVVIREDNQPRNTTQQGRGKSYLSINDID